MAQKSDTTLVMQAEVAATTELDVPKDTTLVIEDLDREGCTKRCSLYGRV